MKVMPYIYTILRNLSNQNSLRTQYFSVSTFKIIILQNIQEIINKKSALPNEAIFFLRKNIIAPCKQTFYTL